MSALVDYESLSSSEDEKESQITSTLDCPSKSPSYLLESEPQERSHDEVLKIILTAVNRLLILKERGLTINAYMLQSKQFQNPYCLQKIMNTFNIIPYASNLPLNIFDSDGLNQYEHLRFQRLIHYQEVPQHAAKSDLKASTARRSCHSKESNNIHKSRQSSSNTSVKRVSKWDKK